MAELYSCSILGKTVPSSINAEKIMHLLNRHKLKIFTKTYLSPKFSKYFQAVNRQKACDQVPRTKSDGRPPCVNTSFCREADENCALLGYYTASSGNSLPTFRDKLPAHFQGSTILDTYQRFGMTYQSHFQVIPLKMGPKGCPETAIRNYYNSLRNSPVERTPQTALFVAFAFAESTTTPWLVPSLQSIPAAPDTLNSQVGRDNSIHRSHIGVI
jgi:hypothetical protein